MNMDMDMVDIYLSHQIKAQDVYVAVCTQSILVYFYFLSIELPTVYIVSSLVLDNCLLICYRLLYYSIQPVDAIDFACDPLY